MRSSTVPGMTCADMHDGQGGQSDGLISLFSKSAHTLRKNASKQFHRVANLRESFGAGTKKKSLALMQVLE